ncbi:MAG: sensor histidine kinase [Oscillospiraceae bacterium]|nr:sensor histidine kinase [Oscillospiraceae bacterium]
MEERRRKRQQGLGRIFLRLLAWTGLAWLALLGVTLSLTLNQALSSLTEKMESDLTAAAASLAGSRMVREALERGRCSEDMAEYLDALVANTPDLDIITIAGADSMRVYHVVPERIGQQFVGGDQGRALAGDAYLSEGVGTMGLQRRAFCPVFDGEGKVLGFVMASATMDRIQIMRREIVEAYCKLALALALATLAAAAALTLLLRRLLHGFGPEGLVRTYLTQNEALGDLDEGLIATDGQGVVKLVNRAAEAMLGQRAERLEGERLDGIIRDEKGGSLLEKRRENAQTSRPNILCTSIPQKKEGRRTGATLILKDRSEAMRRAEQLNGTRHVISALRANTHEFMNKLQVISGLLQMERLEEAKEYIGAISAVQSKLVAPVLQHIQNANTAALLLGKIDHMRELDIQPTLLANSSLPEHSAYLSTEELVTVVGNLLENAIEAVDAQNRDWPRSVVVQITEDERGLLVIVSDTGTGIPPEDLERIYTPGFSTKAEEGRGVGMGLIREIVARREGSIEVDSEAGTGTTFTLIFNKKRGGGEG